MQSTEPDYLLMNHGEKKSFKRLSVILTTIIKESSINHVIEEEILTHMRPNTVRDRERPFNSMLLKFVGFPSVSRF